MALTGGNGGGASAGSGGSGGGNGTSGASGGGPGGNSGKSSKSTGNNGFKMSNPVTGNGNTTQAQAQKGFDAQANKLKSQGYKGFDPVVGDQTITGTGTKTTPNKSNLKKVGWDAAWDRANKLGYVKPGETREQWRKRADEWNKGKTETKDISEKWTPEKDKEDAGKGDGSSTVETKVKKEKTDLEKTPETKQPETPADGKAGGMTQALASSRTPADQDTGGGVGIEGQTAASLQKDNLQLNNQAVNQMA